MYAPSVHDYSTTNHNALLWTRSLVRSGHVDGSHRLQLLYVEVPPAPGHPRGVLFAMSDQRHRYLNKWFETNLRCAGCCNLFVCSTVRKKAPMPIILYFPARTGRIGAAIADPMAETGNSFGKTKRKEGVRYCCCCFSGLGYTPSAVSIRPCRLPPQQEVSLRRKAKFGGISPAHTLRGGGAGGEVTVDGRRGVNDETGEIVDTAIGLDHVSTSYCFGTRVL